MGTVADIVSEELAGWLRSPRHFPARGAQKYTFSKADITTVFRLQRGIANAMWTVTWYAIFPLVATGTIAVNALRICDWGLLSPAADRLITVWLWNTYLALLGWATVGLWLSGARRYVSWQQRTTLPGSTRDSMWLLCSQAVVGLIVSGQSGFLLDQITDSPLFEDILVLLGQVLQLRPGNGTPRRRHA